MKRVIIIGALLLVAFAQPWIAQGQLRVTEDKLTWHSSQSILTNGQRVEQNCVVASDPAASLITLGSDGAVREFSILQQQGTWDNVLENGKVVFPIKFGEDPGVITFEKNDRETIVEIDMTQNPSGVRRKIIVSQVTTE